MATTSLTQSSVCPICKTLLPAVFFVHPCDGHYTITLNGQFHAMYNHESSANAYVYRTQGRHAAAGIALLASSTHWTEMDYEAVINGSFPTELERVLERAAAFPCD